jgi:hypothetical protein
VGLAAALGCTPRTDYQPRDQVLDGLGAPEQERKFSEALTRAVKPRITGVQVDLNRYAYQAEVTVHGAYGIPVGSAGRAVSVYFANVERVDVYENNAVFVVGTNGRVVDKVVFGTPEDARAFADVVASYRALRQAAGN